MSARPRPSGGYHAEWYPYRDLGALRRLMEHLSGLYILRIAAMGEPQCLLWNVIEPPRFTSVHTIVSLDVNVT
jgi:hypothetical protein